MKTARLRITFYKLLNYGQEKGTITGLFLVVIALANSSELDIGFSTLRAVQKLFL